MKRITATVATILAISSSAWAVSPEDKCEATKNKLAGVFFQCRAKAYAKAIKKGESPDFAKCEARLAVKWAAAEQKAADKGAACPTSGDLATVQLALEGYGDAVQSDLQPTNSPTVDGIETSATEWPGATLLFVDHDELPPGSADNDLREIFAQDDATNLYVRFDTVAPVNYSAFDDFYICLDIAGRPDFVPGIFTECDPGFRTTHVVKFDNGSAEIFDCSDTIFVPGDACEVLLGVGSPVSMAYSGTITEVGIPRTALGLTEAGATVDAIITIVDRENNKADDGTGNNLAFTIAAP